MGTQRIALLIEIPTAVLAGGAFGPEFVSWMLESEVPVNQSHAFLVMTIANFLPIRQSKERTESDPLHPQGLQSQGRRPGLSPR